MVILLKFLVHFIKYALLLVDLGPDAIIEILGGANLYIPDCLPELYEFQNRYFPREFFEELYKNEESSPPTPIKIPKDPHPGFYTGSQEYLDFLAKKLNPVLDKYSCSKELLGSKFPPKDGTLIYDFFGEGIPAYKFHQHYLPSFYPPVDSLPNPLGEIFFIIPIDGYSLDGLLLNESFPPKPEETVYGFSKNIFTFLETTYKIVQKPGRLDPELKDFLHDVYSAYRKPGHVRHVFYKSKDDISRKPFRRWVLRKRKNPVSKK